VFQAPFFDEAYYLQTYADVPRNAALKHWIKYGLSEGRRPNASFDWQKHLGSSNPENAVTGITDAAYAVKQYFRSGQAKRDGMAGSAAAIRPLFSIYVPVYVLAPNIDNPNHFSESGAYRTGARKDIGLGNYASLTPLDPSLINSKGIERVTGRGSLSSGGGINPGIGIPRSNSNAGTVPSSPSSPSSMVSVTPSLSPSSNTVGCPETPDQHPHFCGAEFAGFDDPEFFDADFYLAQNPDVAANSEYSTPTTVVKHWRKHGIYESSRKPSVKFDPAYYLERNPDVVNGYVIPFEAQHPRNIGAIRHYLKYGRFETSRVTAPPLPVAQPTSTTVIPSGNPTSVPTPSSISTTPAEAQIDYTGNIRMGFLDFLSREPNAEEVQRFQTRLQSSTQTVAQMRDELANSDERIKLQIRRYYTEFMPGPPSDLDLIWFVGEFRANPARLSFGSARQLLLLKGAVFKSMIAMRQRNPTSAEEVAFLEQGIRRGIESTEQASVLFIEMYGTPIAAPSTQPGSSDVSVSPSEQTPPANPGSSDVSVSPSEQTPPANSENNNEGC
jgi:hypothetical protein